MAPYSNVRKANAATTMTMTMPGPHMSTLDTASASRRTASGRAVRTNTTRPTNYYARPFGSISAAADNELVMSESSGASAPGFYPGLQYFSDAITALPKDVVRQFTLLKEVEAKLHGPQERMSELLDILLRQPVPAGRRHAGATSDPASGQGLLSFTANNSASGSAVPSLINGVAGRHSAHASVTGSLNGEDAPVETDADRARREQYQELMMLSHSMLPNLDEKNVVLAEANRVVGQQDARILSVWPQIELEISEEARLGSMTHWAYSDNRQRRQTAGAGAASRRDVAAANSLAAAASAMHEADIALARKEAGREVARDRVKGRRTEAAGDSDFDDKPRKSQKLGRGKNNAAGLGISTNGEPMVKRKKMGDKPMGGAGMERTVSAPGRGGKARETPRSTPAAEPGVKKTKAKPGPPPRRKLAHSAHASPMLASSPLAPTFNATTMEPPGGRQQSARLRANSSATLLRHETTQDADTNSRPASAAGKNGEKLNGKRKAQDMSEGPEGDVGVEQIKRRLKEAMETLEQPSTEQPDAEPEARPVPSRSDSSHKNSGRTSKVGTPRQDSVPEPDAGGSRARHTRAKATVLGESRDSSSAEPQAQTGGRHRRAISNSHLVKQLAPFNRSPDLDRHRDRDDVEEDLESLGGKEVKNGEPTPMEVEQEIEAIRESRRASVRRPPSRRNTTNTTMRSSPASASRESTPAVSPPPSSARPRASTSTSQVVPAAAVPELDVVEPTVDEEEDESEHDPDDPNEDKYCYCNRGSYGEMVACDNDNCPMEWFHLGCTGLREAPGKDEAWYCRECRPAFAKVKIKGRGRV